MVIGAEPSRKCLGLRMDARIPDTAALVPGTVSGGHTVKPRSELVQHAYAHPHMAARPSRKDGDIGDRANVRRDPFQKLQVAPLTVPAPPSDQGSNFAILDR